jgi:hypothetical protein
MALWGITRMSLAEYTPGRARDSGPRTEVRPLIHSDLSEAMSMRTDTSHRIVPSAYPPRS